MLLTRLSDPTLNIALPCGIRTLRNIFLNLTKYNAGARFVFNDYSYTSSPSDMISKLNWEPLALRRKERRLLVLHQALHGHLSIPVNKILRSTTRPSRYTNEFTFQRIQARKDCFKFSFFPRTVVDWNSLPYDILSSDKQATFKTKLHKHLRE